MEIGKTFCGRMYGRTDTPEFQSTGDDLINVTPQNQTYINKPQDTVDQNSHKSTSHAWLHCTKCSLEMDFENPTTLGPHRQTDTVTLLRRHSVDSTY